MNDSPAPASLDARHTALRVAVLIPCYNEAVAIPKVVADFRAALPQATIYVYDNNSADGTAAAARAAGAVVRRETLQGKGHVVRRMFADVEADIYVLVDGDDTYDAAGGAGDAAADARQTAGHGDRHARHRDRRPPTAPATGSATACSPAWCAAIFGNRVSDMLSGYRVFSRRFVEILPGAGRPGSRPRPSSPCTRWNCACRSARSRPATATARPAASPSCAPTRRPAHPAHHRDAGEGGAAAAVLLRCAGSCCCCSGIGARRAGGDGVPAHRPGAAAADRGAGDRAGAAVVPVVRLRADSRTRWRAGGRKSSGWPTSRCPARSAEVGAVA